MTIDWDGDLLAPIYDSDIATDAMITLPGGGTLNVRAIDAGEGARIGQAIEVPLLEPAAFIRNAQLAALGVPDPKAVVDGTITLNGATWRVINVQPRPTPDGEDKGETMLALYRDPLAVEPTEAPTE